MYLYRRTPEKVVRDDEVDWTGVAEVVKALDA
jgi:hypothetical protein